MSINDENHRVAKIIKDLENRVSDLEETNRTDSSSNPLVTVEDDVVVGDSVDSIQSHDIVAGEWGQTGWAVSTWGE